VAEDRGVAPVAARRVQLLEGLLVGGRRHGGWLAGGGGLLVWGHAGRGEGRARGSADDRGGGLFIGEMVVRWVEYWYSLVRTRLHRAKPRSVYEIGRSR
jgi:hypothetical protein